MYGMVNRGLRAYVETRGGPEEWEQLCQATGSPVRNFVSLERYDDGATYALVGGYAERHGAPLAEVLRDFGQFWVSWVRTQGYESLLRLAGNDTLTLLRNLDGLHARIQLGYPELRSPSFHLEDGPDGALLHYRSQRAGLAPFVEGLVAGVAELFAEQVEVSLVPDGAPDHEVFRVRVLKEAA